MIKNEIDMNECTLNIINFVHRNQEENDHF